MIQHSGFAVHNGLFAPDQCARLLRALIETFSLRRRAGARHLLRIPLIRAVAGDERLLQLAREVVGDSAVPFRATYFDKSLLAK